MHCFICGAVSVIVPAKAWKEVGTPEFVKDMLKHSFLGYKDTMRLDVSTNQPAKVRELIHTSNLSSGDMFHFMEQCEAYSVGIGCLLTIPEKSEYMQNKRAQNE